jgi:RHS repeat-associated protein
VHASNGWRVSAERGGQERHYLHDFDNPMLALDESGTVVWRRLLNRFVDRPLAIERDGQLRWLLTDMLGTVRKEVDSDSQILAEYRYDPFGQQVDGPAPTLDDSLRYTGRDFDLPGGLGYYRARVYDPSLARFVSEDPMMPWHYRYAENNPLIFVDPTGETAVLEYGIILCDLSSIVGTVAPIMVGFAEVMAAAAEGLQGVPPPPGVGGILGPPGTPGDFAFQVFIPCGAPGIYNAATN